MTGKKLAVLICTVVSVFVFQNTLSGQTTFKTGTAIIDMGAATPTVKNSLKPYGLIFALLKNYNVPVYAVVNPTKGKDGIDFVYNGKSYKGGTFIISKEFISTQVLNTITSWQNQGVLVDFTVDGQTLTAETSYKLAFIPRWTMDKDYGDIAISFMNAAGIPATAYSKKTPDQLGNCDDIFVLPHANPTFNSHKNLYKWNVEQKGPIWAGCHAVSVLENLSGTVDINGAPTAVQMNFLSTNGLVSFENHTNSVLPYTVYNPADYVGQYMGKTDGAQVIGSETVYLPKPGGSWRPGTKMLTSSPNQTDVPGLSPGEAAINIYGRAFDQNTRGYVAYQASHNIGGSTPEAIAAQRIFFNFSFVALNDKITPILEVAINGMPNPAEQRALTSTSLTANVTGSASGNVSYQWKAYVNGVMVTNVFSAPNSQTTNFTPDATIAATDYVISCVVSDNNCPTRIAFDSKGITVIPGNPPLTANNIPLTMTGGCNVVEPLVFNVLDYNQNVSAGARTMTALTGLAKGAVLSSTSGQITFTPNGDFRVGITTGQYTLSNGVTAPQTGNITISVGAVASAPSVTTDVADVSINVPTPINVLSNDQNDQNTAGSSQLKVRDIVTLPQKGFARINVDNTITYLSFSNTTQATTDVFTYLTCNTAGYCSEGTVNINLGLSTHTITNTATQDGFIGSNNFGFDLGANEEGQNFDNSSEGIILSFNTTQDHLRIPLIQYDLSGITSIASGAPLTVTQAKMMLTVKETVITNDVFPAQIFRLTKTWSEGSVTFVDRSTGVPWTGDPNSFEIMGQQAFLDQSSASGAPDFLTKSDVPTLPNDPAFEVVSGATLTAEQKILADITSIAKYWVSDLTNANNKGVVIFPSISATDPAVDVKFYSLQNDADKAAKLIVTYETLTGVLTSTAPIGYPDQITTTSIASTINISVLNNDANYFNPSRNELVSVSTAGSGTATATGNIVLYKAHPSFVGVETLTYTLRDNVLNTTSTSTVRVTVTQVAPIVVNDVATTSSLSSTLVEVGNNDTDPQTGVTLGAPVIIKAPKNGTAVVSGNNVIYTPIGSFTGNDQFQYRRSTNALDPCATVQSGSATVTITVNNQPPIAGPANLTTFACGPVTIKLLELSSDPEGGTLTTTAVTSPSHGVLTVTADGSYKYTPDNGFTGVDQFTYKVKDPLNTVSLLSATVSITVTGSAETNIAPSAVADLEVSLINQDVYTDVLSNDSDANNDPLTISITATGLTGPANGIITLLPNKLVKYTPNTGFTGTDTYQYLLIDTHPSCGGGGTLTSVGTVTITVKSVPTSLSGTVINDLDFSAAGTFNSISTAGEIGTNGTGGLYVYATDNANKILDKTPVDIDGTYTLSNVPSQTSGLRLYLSIEDIAIGNTLNAGSVPVGYVNTSPLTRTLVTTTVADMGPYDWGIKINVIMDGGQISATGTVCGTSGIPGQIVSTANATGGSLTSTGYVYKWQYSTVAGGASGFHDISGATTTNLVPSFAITQTTYFRRVVTNNVDGEKYSNVVNITPQAKPVAGIVPSAVTLGRGYLQSPSVGLTASSDIGGVEYLWTPSTSLTLTTSANTNAAPLTSIEYTVTVTSTASGCQSTATTLVKVLYPGVIGTSQVNCGVFTPTAFTSVTDASGLSVTGITYKWQSSTSGINSGYADIPGATSSTYAPGAVSTTTYFRRIAISGGGEANSIPITVTIHPIPNVTITPVSVIIGTGLTTTFTASGADSYVWSPATHLNVSNTATVIAGPLTATTVYSVAGTVTATSCSNTKSITVTVINPGEIGSNQENCGTFTPATLSSVTNASGATGIAYSWERSTTSAISGFAAIDAAVSSTYAPGSTATTTYFRRKASVGGFHFYSNVVTVTIKEIPVATAGNNSPLCAGSTLQLSSSGGAGYSWTGPNSFTSNLQNPSITSVTTAASGMYTVQVTAANGCVGTATTTVTVYALPTITITPTSASINEGDNVSLTAGGANAYSWSPATGLSASNTAQVTAQPAATTTYTVTGTITSTGCSNTTSVIITVVPNGALLPGSIGSDLTICSNTAAAAFTSTDATGGTGTIVYQWQHSTNNTTFTNIPGATAATYNAGTLTQTTYYRRQAKTSDDAAVNSNTVKVTVQLSVAGTISGGGISVCSNINTGSLSLSGHSGSILRWESSVNGFSAVTNITNTASTQLFTNISATTQYRAVVQMGTCAIVTSAPVTVTIKPLPVIGAISGPCAMARDSVKTFLLAPVANATGYIWQLSSGWTGTSTTNSIDVKAGVTAGMITVTAVNSGCSGISSTVSIPVTIIDYAKVTITATPTISAGNLTSTMLVSIQLFDVNGNVVNCSGGIATLCSNVASAVFSTVVDHNDGTYTSYLSSPANDIKICGTVGGIPISKTTNVTFTGPQGGIKANGPILSHEIPKLTFTFTAGTGPFTVVYRSEKSSKNDTLTNVVSGQPINVALIPSTTLYRLVQIIDANGERRVDNFNRDTATVVVLAPKIVVTLKSDTPEHIGDSTWKTRLTLHVKNIGDLDLANVQVKLNLEEVFPNPVTYVLDSVRVNGTTVVKNNNYDGKQETDLFARLKNRNRMPADTRLQGDVSETQEILSADGIEVYGNASGKISASGETEADEEKHSVYMFGPSSQLPVNVDGFMYLYLRIKPNGHHEPFVMQAVALGTGHTEEGSALTTSLSNDNENTEAHPEITEKGDPLPTVINLIPIPVIGVSLAASTPVDQGNGTYNVTLSYKLRNYGNVNLQSVHLYQNLGRMIGSPATFTLVGGVTTTGTLLPNPSFNARLDSNMFLPISELGYEAEGTAQFTINITPNQLSALYRLQAQAFAVFADQNLTTTDLSTDGTNPDPDGNETPSEKVLTLIVINQPIPPLVPPGIGINIDHPNRTTVLTKDYCVSAVVRNIPTGVPTGGSGPYEFQWQISVDNTAFTDIAGATDSVYTTGTLISSVYLRMKVISDNQVAFTNSVHVVIVPAPAKPVITGTATQVVGTGNITLSSSAAATYHWSTGSTLQSINVVGAGSYTVTITDNKGCTATSDAYVITALDPYKVADILKRLTKAPELQSDGSFVMQFRVYASNLRTELIDSVRIKDDLTKVFLPSMNFEVLGIQASGSLIANNLYNGNSNIELVASGSQLPGMKTDSVQIAVKVFSNGFSGTLLNTAEMTGKSPYGVFKINSNDPTVSNGVFARSPTPFFIPLVDLFIPSGFSPNRDGMNDLFVISRPYNTTINLEIFNRWGNLVFRNHDYKNEWGGRGNQPNNILGEELPDGTYYYIVLATDKSTGSVRKFAGFITLKR